MVSTVSPSISKKIAECIGLWLAEGDSKSKGEITFTNNCWDLVEIFHNGLTRLFGKYNPNIRIYVYNSVKKKINIPLKNVKINHYIDKRATKPYYIWRLASVDIVKKWKRIVNETKKNKKAYAGILRGFFAGEGNIKEGSHGSRTIRISQSKRLNCIEKALSFFNIYYKFTIYHRSGYVIQRKENFDKLAKIGLADLHPIKKEKFDKMLNGYKQTHYQKGHLKKKIGEIFKKKGYYTTKELALLFDRSQDRISELLTELKKERLIKNFRVKSRDYWILNSSNKILISAIKYKYLNILKNNTKRIKDIAEQAGVCPRAAGKRLEELKKLGLVERDKNKKWERMKVKKKVVVI